MLLSLIPLLFNFGFVFLSLHFGFFDLILELFGLLQLLLQSCHLLLEAASCSLASFVSFLWLSACFSAPFEAASALFLSSQLLLKISIVVFSNGKGLHSSNPLLFLIVQLLRERMEHLLQSESALDSL